MNRGIRRERQVRVELENDDWVTMRAAGSLGPIDVVALRDDRRPRFIEVKSTADGPYKTFGPADRADLIAIAARAGAEAWLAWWPPRGRLRWIPASEWPIAKGATG